MSARFTIIDGYNLMYAAGFCQVEYAPGDLMRCRTRLLKWLLEKLTPAEINRTTVVFDAREPPPGRPDRVMVGGLTVLFAREQGEADALIEQLIERHFSPKQLTVVSSDHRLHKSVRARRGEAIDSDRFLDDKERRRPKPLAETAEKPPAGAPTGQPAPPARGQAATSSGAGSTDEWLREFGAINVNEEITDADLPSPRVVETAQTSAASSEATSGRKPAPAKPAKPKGTPAGNDESRLPQADDLDGWLNVFTRTEGPGDPRNAAASARGRSPESSAAARRANEAFRSSLPQAVPGEETELARRRRGLDRLPDAAAGSTVSPPSPAIPKPSSEAAADVPPAVDDGQVDYWMRMFGEVSGKEDVPKPPARRGDHSGRPKDV